MTDIYNFSNDSAMMPEDVAEKLIAKIAGKKGKPLFDIGYSSSEFQKILSDAERLLRKLLDIPLNYKVMFMPGSATAQYSAIPLNLLSEHKCADYVLTGRHAKNASLEAKKYGDIVIADTSAGSLPAYSSIPEMKRSDFRPDADYVHICFNNAQHGTKYFYIPDTGNIPLVADMTSSLLSEPINVMRFGLIYASSGINIGPSGMCVVIVRTDLVGSAMDGAPSALNYASILEKKSIFNRPPIVPLYGAKLMLEKLMELGGLDEIKHRNEHKASLMYDYLDSQSYYTAPVDKKCRSTSNVVFFTGDASLDAKFVKEAEESGFAGLARDKTLGGMCASLYNSMPVCAVEGLVSFMKKFARENPKLTT